MKPGDLVVFSDENPHPSLVGWFGRLATVLESEIRPIFPNEHNSATYERITVLLNEGRVASSPAGNWSVLECTTELPI